MENIKEMETLALEERKAEIGELSSTVEAEKLPELEEELRAIKEELEERKTVEAQRKALAEAVAEGAGEVKETIEPVEERTMENIEIRNTKEYIDAYAEYIKTGDDRECRALLTENVSGTVPVPEFVYNEVKTAWEANEITRRVKKAYMKGNVKVGFEISSTGATVHTEGGDPVNEETLTLGVVNMVPKTIKKWISISTEVYDTRGEEFLRYLYDELTYKIAQKAADELLDKIFACGTVGTTTQVAVGRVAATQINVGLVAQAMGSLSAEATDPVVVLNPATWAAFKAAQAANGYNYDPFEGLTVIKNSHVTAFSAATTGVPYMLVGDFGYGAMANFPAGEEVKFVFDDNTLMTQDLIRIIGREYVAIEPVACNAFVQVAKSFS